MPIQYKPFDAPPPPEKSTLDHIIDTVGTVARTAPQAIRVGTGFAGAEGGLPGALIGGGGELAAQLLESLNARENRFNLSRVGVEGALGAIPAGKLVSKGKALASAAKGATMAAAGVEGRKWAEGVPTPTPGAAPDAEVPKEHRLANPLTEWGGWDWGQVGLGGLIGGVMGKATKPGGGGGGEAPPPATPPRPDITKPAGLRVFVDKNIKPSIDEHEKLSKVLEGQAPTGEHYTTLGTNPKDVNPSVATLATREEQGSAVQRSLLKQDQQELERLAVIHEARGDKARADALRKAAVDSGKASAATARKVIADRKAEILQEGKNENARQKFVEKDQVQTARNKTARDLYIKKTQEQHARNLTARGKYLENQTAQGDIKAAKEGLVAQPPIVTERTTAKDGQTSETAVTRYAPPPPPPKNPGVPASDAGIPPEPTPVVAPPATRTIFPSQLAARGAAHAAGAIGEIKIGRGKWVHVMPGEKNMPTAASIAAEATPPAGPPPRTMTPSQEEGINQLDELQKSIHGDEPPTVGNGGFKENSEPNGAPTGPKNLTKSAPMDDINDVDLATGVVKVNEIPPVQTPTKVFNNLGQAQKAAKQAGVPTTEIEPVAGGGYRVAPQKPTAEVGYSRPNGVEDRVVAAPEGTAGVYENGEMNYDRRFKPAEKPIDIKQQLQDSLKAGKKGGNEPEGGSTPPEGGTPPTPTGPKPGPKGGPKGGGKKQATQPLTPEQLDQLSITDRNAYLKKQAPVNDATFMQRHDLLGDVPEPFKAEFMQLAAEAPRMKATDVYKRLASLKARYGATKNNLNMPPSEQIGSRAWSDAQGIVPDVEKQAELQSAGDAAVGDRKDAVANLVGKFTQEESDPAVQGLADSLVNRRGGEGGFVDPDFAASVLFHGIPAVAGAAIGGHTDEDNPMRGAVIGGLTGLAAPLAIRQLGKMHAEGGVGEGVRNWAQENIPSMVRFNLLTSPQSLAINTIAAPAGSAITGAIEHGLTGLLKGDMEQAGQGGKAVVNVVKNFSNPNKYNDAWNEAKRLIGRNERGELMTGEANTPFQRAMATPGTMMTTGDVIGRDSLMSAGISEKAARAMTATDEPSMPFMHSVLNAVRGTKPMGVDEPTKRSIMMRIMLPFTRTTLNVLEGSLERAPLLGVFVNWLENPNIQEHIAEVAVQQGMGTAVAYMSYKLGQHTDPQFAKDQRIQKLVSNMVGQYGTIAAIGFAAGQAQAQGKSQMGAAIAAGSSDVPLPTLETPIDVVKSAANLSQSEHVAHPNATHWPQKYLPNIVVPGFLRDQSVDSVEDFLQNTYENVTGKPQGGITYKPF